MESERHQLVVDEHLVLDPAVGTTVEGINTLPIYVGIKGVREVEIETEGSSREIRVSLDGNGENGSKGTGSSTFKGPEKFGEQAFVDREV
jgi:hypothetical protein